MIQLIRNQRTRQGLVPDGVRDAPFPGPSGLPPLIGLDNDTTGFSFVSEDGGKTFTVLAGFNFFFDLVAKP